MKLGTVFLLPLLFAWLAAPVQALPFSQFQLEWERIDNPGAGTASAMMTIDEELIANPGENYQLFGSSFVTDFMLTFGGTSAFAGVTFLLSEISDIVFVLGTPVVDLTAELLGQPGFEDFNVFDGTDATSGAIVDGYAPKRFSIYERDSSGAVLNREDYQLSSFAPKAVPVSAPLTLLILGLAGIGYSRKRFGPVKRV